MKFQTKPDQILGLRNLRLAMKYGRDIVPLYAFGENSLYTTYDIGLGLRQWVARIEGPKFHPSI